MIASLIEWVQTPLKKLHIEKLAKLQTSGNINRFCYHADEESDLHVMLISLPPFTNYPFHRHLRRDEFYIVMDGCLDVILGGDGKEPLVMQTMLIGSGSNLENQNLGLMVPHGTWHSTVTKSEGAVFIECRCGPFFPDDTKYFDNTISTKR